jgi:hypothetical protein
MCLTDKNAQNKIHNLELQMIKKNIKLNVHGIKKVSNNHVVNMCGTKRVKYLDGFYMYTIQQQIASHGVLIFKKTLPNKKVKLSLFDPNGIKNINSGYKLHFDKNIVSYEMTPSRVWNDHFGHCALWCLVFIILYNNFDKAAQNLFDINISGAHLATLAPQSKAGIQNFNFRKAFIEDIYKFIVNGRNFDTEDETKKFIEKVKNKINDVILYNQ